MSIEQNFEFYDELDFQYNFENDYLNYRGITKVYRFGGGGFGGPKKFGGGGFGRGKFKGNSDTPKILNLPQYGPTYKPKPLKPFLGILGLIRPAKKTEYFKLFNNKSYTAGISHHPKGLGKLKIYDKAKKRQYGVPLINIHNKPMKKWRFDLKPYKPFKPQKPFKF